MKKNDTLLVFSIGPVQGFIAAARKLEDLWSGSYLLSHLTERAIVNVVESAERQGIACNLIYPKVNLDKLKAPSDEENIEVASLPNRFVCYFDADQRQTAEIAREAVNIVKGILFDIGRFAINKVFPVEINREYMLKLLSSQVDALLEIFWATESFEDHDDFSNARTKLEGRLAAVKNCRPYRINEQEGLVCTLCGEHQALTSPSSQSAALETYGQMKLNLDKTWGQRNLQFKISEVLEEDKKVGRIKDGEGLCGICLSKRLARDYFKKHKTAKHAFEAFPSTHDIAGKTKYYAVIMMDGDDMGKWISGAKHQGASSKVTMKDQENLSAKLDRFAVHVVPEIVKKGSGKLIYAGGDDVLAFLPVQTALATAKALRLAFSNDDTGLDARATASMGIVVAHQKAPLNMVLDYARTMEGRAKGYRHHSGKSKDALGLAVLTHSGEIREAVLPWAITGGEHTGEPGNCAVSYLQGLLTMVQEQLSVSFLEHFAQAFLPLLGAGLKKNQKIAVFPGDPHKNRQLLESEMSRVLRRSAREGYQNVDFSIQARQLIDLHELMSSSLQFVHFMEMIRFFKKMEENDEAATHAAR